VALLAAASEAHVCRNAASSECHAAAGLIDALHQGIDWRLRPASHLYAQQCCRAGMRYNTSLLLLLLLLLLQSPAPV
jgi:hypothetical protein